MGIQLSTSSGAQQSKRKSMHRRLKQALSCLPLAADLLAIVLLTLMMAIGGLWRVRAWYWLQLKLPLLGLITLITTCLSAGLRRKINRLACFTAVMSLICLIPVSSIFLHVPYPASINSTKPSITVHLPANVPLKVGWGGDTYDVNHHVMIADQRWAYDFLVAPYLSGSLNLSDYGCYGIPVVAPAAGVVVKAHDGEPDMIPGKLSMNTSAPSGNTIAIRIDETGTYLVIAHLKPGSLRVSTGDRVEEGQVIGQCGNSGMTSEPHIHIHHQRQDPNLFAPGWAEGLPLYFRDQDGPPMPHGGIKIEAGIMIATGVTVRPAGGE